VVCVSHIQAEQTSARMLMLQLTDGAVQVRGMEYSPIPALNASLSAGTKVRISLRNWCMHSFCQD